MIDTAQFLYQHSPIFWYALAGVFFLLGLLYANFAWRSYKHQLRSAQREKAQLLRERNQALADRQRRRQLREREVANGVVQPTATTAPRPNNGNATGNTIKGFTATHRTSDGTVASNGNGSNPHGLAVDATTTSRTDEGENDEAKARRRAAEEAIRKRESSQPNSTAEYASGVVTPNGTNGKKPSNLAELFSSSYQSSGPKKNGSKPH